MAQQIALPLAVGHIVGVQWSFKNDIIAIGHNDEAQNTSTVLLAEPNNPNDLVQLRVSEAGAQDALVHLEWTGFSSRRALFTVTKHGQMKLWIHGASSSEPQRSEPCCLDVWHAQAVVPAQHSSPITARLITLSSPTTFSTDHLNNISQLDVESIDSVLPKSTSSTANHWLRPGMIVIATIDENVQLSFIWEEQQPEGIWKCSTPIALSTPDHSKALIAWTAAVAEGCTIRVAFACMTASNVICLNTISGNPVFAACSGVPDLMPRVEEARSAALPAGQQVQQLAFTPDSLGSVLLCLSTSSTSDAAGARITSHTVTRLHIAHSQIHSVCSYDITSSSTTSSMAVSPDGELVTIALGSQQVTLHTSTLQPSAQSSDHPSTAAVAAMCYSPNSACLCSIITTAEPATPPAPAATRALLSIKALDQAAINPPPAAAADQQQLRCQRLAARMALCLLLGHQHWDLAHALLQLGQADGHASTAQVLGILDSLFHNCQLRNSLQLPMDRLKLAVLQQVPLRAAEVLCIDLRMSILLHWLASLLPRINLNVNASVRAYAETYKDQKLLEEAKRLLSSAEPHWAWAKGLLHFTLSCTRAFLERSVAATAAAAPPPEPVPWVSLVPSAAHLVLLQEVLKHFKSKPTSTTYTLALLGARTAAPSLLRPGSTCCMDLEPEIYNFMAALKLLLHSLMPAGGGPYSAADLARSTLEAYGAYRGPFRMHYVRVQGRVGCKGQEALQKFDSLTNGRYSSSCSDEALWQQARDLGLLPPKSASSSQQQVVVPEPAALLQLHASFRAAVPVVQQPQLVLEPEAQQLLLGPAVLELVGTPGVATELAPVPEQALQQLQKLRQRWQQQRAGALGLLQPQRRAGAAAVSHDVDVLDLGSGRQEGGLAFVAADGSCGTELLHGQDMQAGVLGKRHWACGSPFTGSVWKRSRA